MGRTEVPYIWLEQSHICDRTRSKRVKLLKKLQVCVDPLMSRLWVRPTDVLLLELILFPLNSLILSLLHLLRKMPPLRAVFTHVLLLTWSTSLWISCSSLTSSSTSGVTSHTSKQYRGRSSDFSHGVSLSSQDHVRQLQ